MFPTPDVLAVSDFTTFTFAWPTPEVDTFAFWATRPNASTEPTPLDSKEFLCYTIYQALAHFWLARRLT